MDPVNEVKSRLGIEDVVGEYVRLKRAGQNYKGLSPFTNEKTPSFIVSPGKQIWHDFSSGKGGDIFTFIQEAEGVDFKDALELLARKAGVDLDQFKNTKSYGPSKEKLHQILDLSAKFYQVHFTKKTGAIDYISKKRGYNKQTALDFRIGYSPNSGRALVDFLVKKSFSEQEIKAAGLSTVRNARVNDMFRGRIMIPLMDQFGKVIGFTARLLDDDGYGPKYINTPQTVVYDKSRHVFGLHLAKQAIKENKYSVIAEGNLDVIASHQAGIKNVVATAGTAMTEQQLKILGRLSPDIRLAFDQDRAGLAAAERAIPIASRAGVNLSIITLPEGKDPDDLIKQDKKLWEKAINNHQYALDWLIDRYKDKIDLSSAQGIREFSDVIVNVVRELSDDVEKDHYIGKIAEITGVSAESVKQKLNKNEKDKTILKKPKAIKDEIKQDSLNKDWQRTSDRLLSLALMVPSIRNFLELISPEMMQTDNSKKVLDFLKQNPDFDGSVESAQKLKPVIDYVKVLSLQFEELYGDVDMLEFQYEASRLRAKIVQYFVKRQKTLISESLRKNPDDRELLRRSREFDRLLNKIWEQ